MEDLYCKLFAHLKKHCVRYFIFICFFSCSKERFNEVYFFSKYDKNGRMIEKEELCLKVMMINDTLKEILILNKDSLILKYKEFENNTGVYREFSDEFRPYYSFDSSSVGGTNDIFPPIVNMESWLINKKIIKVDNNIYEIYHFNELSYCSPSISTYWVKGIGLIAVFIYDGKKEQYYLCDRIEGNITKSTRIKKIGENIINDSTFFKKAKYLPCT